MNITVAQKETILQSIRKVPDYPKPGILFYDITTLLNNGKVFCETIDILTQHYKDYSLDYIAGIESRGFIFGAALAQSLRIGFVPIRKKGKLPFTTISEKYSLEYGFDEIEVHIDAFKSFNNTTKPKVLLIDDLIATGGTAAAAVNLINKADGDCVEACFIINLIALHGLDKVEPLVKVNTLLDI